MKICGPIQYSDSVEHYTDPTSVGRTLQDALSAGTFSTVEGKVVQVIYLQQQSSNLTFEKYGLMTIENYFGSFLYI